MRTRAIYPTAIAAMILIFGASSVRGQEVAQDDINPRLLRNTWIYKSLNGGRDPRPNLLSASPPYVLTQADRDKFKGTFGFDVAHYEFDLSNNAKCKIQSGYDDPECSCTINWQSLIDDGLTFVHLKATDGKSPDLSFARNWRDLEAKHTSKALFRGAYHFLRPGIDAETQANVYLNAIGAVDGRKPSQLPPVLDIEWTNSFIAEGTAEFDACPQSRRQLNGTRYYCDVWYKVSAKDIVALATKWIDLVESATGQRVIIYTNPNAWWDPVMGDDGRDFIKNRAVWTSRYKFSGPSYDPNWTRFGGSPKWNMPPLMQSVTYPQDTYNVPHFWQFSDSGSPRKGTFTCKGNPDNSRIVDMSWVPVSGADFQTLFGVAGQ